MGGAACRQAVSGSEFTLLFACFRPGFDRFSPCFFPGFSVFSLVFRCNPLKYNETMIFSPSPRPSISPRRRPTPGRRRVSCAADRLQSKIASGRLKNALPGSVSESVMDSRFRGARPRPDRRNDEGEPRRPPPGRRHRPLPSFPRARGRWPSWSQCPGIPLVIPAKERVKKPLAYPPRANGLPEAIVTAPFVIPAKAGIQGRQGRVLGRIRLEPMASLGPSSHPPRHSRESGNPGRERTGPWRPPRADVTGPSSPRKRETGYEYGFPLSRE